LQVNYDQGIKYGRDYTVKSYFTSPNGTQGEQLIITPPKMGCIVFDATIIQKVEY
jgi:hypothetical protein